MEIKLFSKWRPSAVLNFQKLQFWSRDLYRYVIRHLSEFRVHRPIRRHDIAKKRYSIWRPSAILNLRKLPFWSRDRYLHVIFHLHSEICTNRSVRRRDIAKIRFSIWRPSAILNLKNFDFFCQISMLGMEICICVPNLIELG